MWNHVIEVFRTQIQKASFDAWVKPMKLFAVTSNEVIVTFEDAMSQSVMVGRYRQRVEILVRNVFGMDYSLKIIDPREAERQQQLVSEAMLNPKYTFETFVTGPSNSFAYAASLAVAEQPREVYNPLFLYGDVGLGKTHLMNAIGNFIMTERPMSRVLLTTSERFTNELIDAIVKKKGTAELRAKMRNVDVLMVDDIQFLSKTTATQEEFFHTFNDLYNNGKQIIISSDRPPNELPTIEERLRSRFGSGLIVDIQKPDFETRVAILRKKADGTPFDLYSDLDSLIAQQKKAVRYLRAGLLLSLGWMSITLMNILMTLMNANVIGKYAGMAAISFRSSQVFLLAASALLLPICIVGIVDCPRGLRRAKQKIAALEAERVIQE